MVLHVLFLITKLKYDTSQNKTQLKGLLLCENFFINHQKAANNTSIQINIGIKHDFSHINIRRVPWEVLKTKAFGLGFQHLPRDLANVNALNKSSAKWGIM